MDNKKLAMDMVSQLFDIAEVPIEKRQAVNDKADDFVFAILRQFGKHHASIAWDESRHSFAKECGEDVSDIEEESPVFKNKADYLTKTFPIIL